MSEEEISRCPAVDATGLQCQLYDGHEGQHSAGREQIEEQVKSRIDSVLKSLAAPSMSREEIAALPDKPVMKWVHRLPSETKFPAYALMELTPEGDGVVRIRTSLIVVTDPVEDYVVGPYCPRCGSADTQALPHLALSDAYKCYGCGGKWSISLISQMVGKPVVQSVLSPEQVVAMAEVEIKGL